MGLVSVLYSAMAALKLKRSRCVGPFTDASEAVAITGGDDGRVGPTVDTVHLGDLISNLLLIILVDAGTIDPPKSTGIRDSLQPSWFRR